MSMLLRVIRWSCWRLVVSGDAASAGTWSGIGNFNINGLACFFDVTLRARPLRQRAEPAFF